jgi:hypothetical protein
MKKFITSVVLGIVIFINPMYVSAATICYSLQMGLLQAYFQFSGGKVDQKPFAGRFINFNVPCEIPVWASMVTDSDGVHYISINMSHDPEKICSNGVWFHASGQTVESMTGEVDLGQNGTYEGVFSLSKVNCNSIEQQ